jgi:20S proteasome alpha/beta subunit
MIMLSKMILTKIIFLVILLSLARLGLSQSMDSSWSRGGTLAVAIIAKDGIMIATDSRAVLKQRGVPIAYCDSMQKINMIGNFAVACVGLDDFKGQSLVYITKDFNKQYKNTIDLTISISDFIKYLDTYYSQQPYDSNQFISGVYLNGLPETIAMSKSIPTKIDWDQGITSNPKIGRYYPNNARSMTCKELAQLSTTIFYRFAKDYQLDYIIGGPITAIQITPDNQIHYLQNDFNANQYTNDSNLYLAFLQKRKKFYFIGSDGEQKFLDFVHRYLRTMGIKY